jgi:urease accessory protein
MNLVGEDGPSGQAGDVREGIVSVAILPEQADTFAANRALGRIALAVAAADGCTRRTRVHEQGSLRVRFPNAAGGDCEAVLVNTAGGIAGGDRFDLDVAVGAGARLQLTTAAAEKVYRSLGPDARVAVRLAVAAGGALAWLPQETILFDRARLERSIDVDLADDATLLLCETVVFGRTAMGERVNDGALGDRWRVRRAGRLVFADTLRLDGAIAATLAQPAAANGAAALATVLLAPGEAAAVEAVRAHEDRFLGEVGISAWNGIALVRFCAPDGTALRHDLILALAAIGRDLPRLWLN